MARGRYMFWLDFNKDDELLLAETIDELKRKRSFIKTLRDGIRLICNLREGKVDVLFELFPWVKAEFIAGIQPQETAGERALREYLERIERQLLAGSTGANPKPLSGPKPLNVPKFAAPAPDDDDDLIVVKKDTSNQGVQNFLDSLMRLQQ
jgi:hypothetical protein